MVSLTNDEQARRVVYCTQRDEAIYLLVRREQLENITLDKATNRFTYSFTRGEYTGDHVGAYRSRQAVVNLYQYAHARRFLADWEWTIRHGGEVAFPVRVYASREGVVA